MTGKAKLNRIEELGAQRRALTAFRTLISDTCKMQAFWRSANGNEVFSQTLGAYLDTAADALREAEAIALELDLWDAKHGPLE